MDNEPTVGRSAYEDIAPALSAGTAMLGLALIAVVALIVRPGGAAEAAGIWKRRTA